MSHIEILLPFGLPPAELANDLMRELRLPSLAMLLSRARSRPLPGNQDSHETDGFARTLPHEIWLSRRFGMSQPAMLPDAASSPSVAVALMRTYGLEPAPGHWFIVQPVHFHIARDHLVLTDLRRLALSEADSRALYTAALPAFEEAGHALLYGTADCWFMRADGYRDLRTATPDATCGRNIDIWMPTGDAARAWRKLQNAVQMEWHAHAVNENRAMAGNTPVNSLWLWGGASSPQPDVTPRQEALFGFDGWLAAFGRYATSCAARTTVADVLANPSENRLLLLDDLTEAALAGDWSYWMERFHQLEKDWFAPLLQVLSNGGLGGITLIIGDGAGLRGCSATRTSLRKFWIRPTLARLMP